MFRLDIETGNAAFDGGQREREIARILRGLALQLERAAEEFGGRQPLFDINGNRVGEATLEGRRADGAGT